MATAITRPATQQLSDVEAGSAVLVCLGKVLAKEAKELDARDELTDGATYGMKLRIEADIDGRRFDKAYEAEMTIGHESDRETGRVSADKALAFVLGHFAPRTREKILGELAASEGKLTIDDSVLESVKVAMASIKASRVSKVRGDVKVDYSSIPQLSLKG